MLLGNENAVTFWRFDQKCRQLQFHKKKQWTRCANYFTAKTQLYWSHVNYLLNEQLTVKVSVLQ
jgi:hypothetical protein